MIFRVSTVLAAIAAIAAVVSVPVVHGDLSHTIELLDQVNAERASVGVPALCLNSKLTAAAQRHANDMSNKDFVRNDGSDKSTLMDRLHNEGFNFTGIGEVIAAGQTNASGVVGAWLRSPWHRSILLSEAFTFFGGAHANNPETEHVHFWVEDFAAANEGERCDDPVSK